MFLLFSSKCHFCSVPAGKIVLYNRIGKCVKLNRRGAKGFLKRGGSGPIFLLLLSVRVQAALQEPPLAFTGPSRLQPPLYLPANTLDANELFLLTLLFLVIAFYGLRE